MPEIEIRHFYIIIILRINLEMLPEFRSLLFVLLTFQMVYSDEVLIVDKLNFAEVIKEGLVLVHFYTPKNPVCKDIAPVLEELALKVASDGIKIGKVDCRAAGNYNKKLCDDNQCASFPTLNLYNDGIKVAKFPQERYAAAQEGKRTLEEFEYFVKNLKVMVHKEEL